MRDCSNITIRNARIGSLNVVNSKVELTDTDILDKEADLKIMVKSIDAEHAEADESGMFLANRR